MPNAINEMLEQLNRGFVREDRFPEQPEEAVQQNFDEDMAKKMMEIAKEAEQPWVVDPMYIQWKDQQQMDEFIKMADIHIIKERAPKKGQHKRAVEPEYGYYTGTLNGGNNYIFQYNDKDGKTLFAMDANCNIECADIMHTTKAARAFMKQVRKCGFSLEEYSQNYTRICNENDRLTRLVANLEYELETIEHKNK